jgi:hypothetical protein
VLQLLPSADEIHECRTAKTNNNKIKEEGNSIIPGKHAMPGRRESAAPCSAPG